MTWRGEDIFLTEEIAADFWKNVIKDPALGNCWSWKDQVGDLKGYCKLNGIRTSVHRVAFVLTHGWPLPSYHRICRRKNECLVKHCINPDHYRHNPITRARAEKARKREAWYTIWPIGTRRDQPMYPLDEVTPVGPKKTIKMKHVRPLDAVLSLKEDIDRLVGFLEASHAHVQKQARLLNASSENFYTTGDNLARSMTRLMRFQKENESLFNKVVKTIDGLDNRFAELVLAQQEQKTEFDRLRETIKDLERKLDRRASPIDDSTEEDRTVLSVVKPPQLPATTPPEADSRLLYAYRQMTGWTAAASDPDLKALHEAFELARCWREERPSETFAEWIGRFLEHGGGGGGDKSPTGFVRFLAEQPDLMAG